MNRTQWIELFRAIGLDDPRMHQWHQEFERRYPEQHQAFLEWLEFTPPEIDQARRRSRAA
jgi:hypothetical protein